MNIKPIVIALSGMFMLSSTTKKTEKPDLVFIFSDQQTFDMLGCYDNKQVKTPNLDKFAEQGVRFTHCFSNFPISTPFRGMLMTGQQSLYNGTFVNDKPLVPGHGKKFAEVLRDAGYNTAYIGEWHLQGGDRNRPTCHRTDQIYGDSILRDQELPAVYPISALKNLYTYLGNTPFSNTQLDNPAVVNLSSGFWGIYKNVSEHWMAFVDGNLWGMGIYNPKCDNFLAGMAGSPDREATDGSTSYIAPVKKEILYKKCVYEYEYYVIIGTLSEIRSKVYQLHSGTN